MKAILTEIIPLNPLRVAKAIRHRRQGLKTRSERRDSAPVISFTEYLQRVEARDTRGML